jgi:hypothetical protein
VDFVLPGNGGRVDAIECKWNSEAFEVNSLKVFREAYREGRNMVIAPNVTNSYERHMGGLKIEFLPISALRERVVERN